MKKFLIIFLVLIVVVIAGALSIFFYVDGAIKNPQGSGPAQLFVIAPGEGAGEIASRLEASGLIKNGAIFQYYLWKQQLGEKLRAGSYEIKPELTMPEVADLLTGSSSNPLEQKVTLREGLRRDEIAHQLAEAHLVSEQKFMDLTEDASVWEYDFLKDLPRNATLEGFLFPDTYIFHRNDTEEDVINEMLTNFALRTQDVRESLKGSNTEFFEVLTLASIVEKEVAKTEDRKIVAGIFNNRLEVGMPLQSNVTVNFVLKNSEYNLSLDDIKVKSPYNTYQNEGLPPGPIDSPSLDALQATAEPTSTDYLFFLTKKDGTPVYSKTGVEHEAAKKQFLD